MYFLAIGTFKKKILILPLSSYHILWAKFEFSVFGSEGLTEDPDSLEQGAVVPLGFF